MSVCLPTFHSLSAFLIVRETDADASECICSGTKDWALCNGSKEGRIEYNSKWILVKEEVNLAVKGSRTVESTCSFEGVFSYGGKKAKIEKLWEELFSDPTEWLDHRLNKVNLRFPDFKHKKQTHRALWLNFGWVPPWVKEKLAALPPGTIQLSPFLWNQRLLKCAQAGQFEKTLELFQEMHQNGTAADRFTFPPVLKACAGLGFLEHGRCIHKMMRPGFEEDLFIGSTLVDMYAKCGSIEEAERVFNQMPTRNVVAWTALILGYVKWGEGQKALKLFEQMQQEGVDPNPVTFIGVLNACASALALEEGRYAHKEIIFRGFEVDFITQTCLVNMYAKCGSIEEAERVFNDMYKRNVVAWNAMIFGYVKLGEGQKALELFEQMQKQQVDPNLATFVGILNACSNVAALEGGRCVHREIIRRGFNSSIVVGNSLVDMYVKCGSIQEAERVFNWMRTRDVVTWTTILAGYGSHGHAREALQTFEQMCEVVEVNGVTFTSLLLACSHGGLVDEGLHAFQSMSKVYNIAPTVDHLTCVIDLLGRAGHLFEAENMIRTMPMDPDATVWMSLLSACRAHVNVELGEHCAQELLELDPENSAGYVLLADIYAAAGEGREQWKRSSQAVGQVLDKNTRMYVY